MQAGCLASAPNGGHPWEATLCIWGDALVALLSPVLSALLPIVRSN